MTSSKEKSKTPGENGEGTTHNQATPADCSEAINSYEKLQESLEEIKRQRRFYKTIYDNVLDGVLIQDENGRILHANPAAERILKISLSEMTAENYEQHNPVDWFDEIEQPFVWKDHAQQTFFEPVNRFGMIRIIHKFRQDPCWLSLHSLVLPSGIDHPAYILTTVRDITQLKYTERRESLLYGIAQRVLSEQPLIETFQYLCDELVFTFGYPVAVIGLKEPDGSVKINASAGMSPSMAETIPARWDDTPEGQGGIGNAIRSGKIQIHNLFDDTRFKPWWTVYESFKVKSLAVFPLKIYNNSLGILALYARQKDYFDTTVLASLQSLADQIAVALWTAEDRDQLRLQNMALTAASNAIVITDTKGCVLWANSAFSHLTGYDLEKVQGRNMRFLQSGVQDQVFYKQMWQTILAGQSWHGELVNRRANGSIYSEEMTVTPVKDEERNIKQFIAIKQDISERLASQRALRDSEEQFRDMFETMNSAVAVFRPIKGGQNFVFTDFNRAAEQIENISRQEVIGHLLTEIFPMAEPLGYLKLVQQVYSIGEKLDFPAFFYQDNRSKGWREGVIYKLMADKIVLLYDDVTQRIMNEKALWQEKERAQVTLASIGDAVLTTDVEGKITYLNSVAEVMTGWTNQEAQGLPVEKVFDIYHESSHTLLEQPIYKCLLRKRTIALANHAMLRHRDQRKAFYIEDSAAPIRDRDQQVIGAVLVFHDVSEKKALLSRLEHQAYHDPLTDLPNRLLLKDRIHQAILQAKSRQEHVAVIFLDLDDFKQVNDTLGHTIGDNLLCQVAERLRRSLRPDDTVARHGGDEFIILSSGLSSEQQVAQIAQNLLDVISDPFDLGDEKKFITASIGIALYPIDGDNSETLIQHADIAMYQAKTEGSNHYRFYTLALNERLVLQNEMRTALERQEFVLYYQPQFSLVDGRLCGLEALVRWQHPVRGLLMPGSFISIAEESGLILPLGERVLHTACAQNKQLQDQGYPPVRVAVNLSARQFRQRDLARQVGGVLITTGLESKWLELEITESLSMEDVEQTIETLQKLKAMGIHLAIDDFGTGFSSLNYLSRFPINTLKIDRSFITELNSRPEGQAIVLTIIQLAQTLGLSVIAEGVETEEQMEFLRTRGCDKVQGFLLAKPMPMETLLNFLNNNNNLKA
jgi:diguanylate cyclase (GGDEF)-like protein/PAS domain S-box-containing protein